ncbi:MAG: hypothetical protein RIS47_196 [Bacteroidota bacterium]|jgi:cytoskeletal protein CcmA (bactofilin family)
MFAGRKEVSTVSNEIDINSSNKIAQGTVIVGEVKTDGFFRLEGTLTGNLTAKGKVVLGATGKIKGNVVAGSADIEGEIEGKLIIEDILVLRSTAKVFGEITTNKLTIESGAVFNGTCDMSGGALSSSMQHNANANARKTEKPQAKAE